MNANTPSSDSDEAMQVTRQRPLQECFDEVERELNVRARCFPRWIKEGRVSRTDAQDRYDRLHGAFTALGAILEGEKAAQ